MRKANTLANAGGRNVNGTFASGNTFGLGRPRRPIEIEYLAALSDACSIDTWREIVNRAVQDAKDGDDKARVWLSRYLIGESSASLRDLAKLDILGINAAHAVRAEVEADMEDSIARLMADEQGLTLMRRAQSIALRDRESVHDE
jgi:hypothetical protein